MNHSPIALLLAGLLLSGCQLLGPGHDPRWPDLDRNRELWASNTAGSYEFELFRSCFCRYAGRFHVRVVDYDVESVQDLLSARPLPITDFESFRTIEELFDLVEDARRRRADVVEIEFTDRGYPSRITIDYSRQVADDELHVEVTNVSSDE
jgi:hypothetical protein